MIGGSALPHIPDAEFLKPRNCLRDPVPPIFEAAELLAAAADAYLDGRGEVADQQIRTANFPEIREWIESLWGSVRNNPEQPFYHRVRTLDPAPEKLPMEQRARARMPTATEKAQVIARDGWHCRYCGIPLIHTEARNILRRAFPQALVWGLSNREKHAAFQCMTPEYDHVVPHCFGGESTIENTILTCGPCNCGKFDRLLEHHGLLDPRLRDPKTSNWDGLTRLLPLKRP